jgi:rubredoxin
MASSPPRKRLYTQIPTRLFTPEAQPSQFVDEMTQNTHPPSPSAFIEEPILDSPHTLSDTANTRFAESPRDLDTPKCHMWMTWHKVPILAYYWIVDKSVR